MILLNGCSFSAGTALKDAKHAYPNLLSDMLNEEIINLSEESKNNFYMAFELNAWILHKLHNNEELPRIIIWQHTDCFRNHLPDYTSSGTWKFNNLKSLIGRLNSEPELSFAKRHIKIAIFKGWDKINQSRARLAKSTDTKEIEELSEFEQKWGLGTTINHRIPFRLSINGELRSGSNILSRPICDSEFVVQNLQHAINIYNLQMLCNTLNIKLINYNYYHLGSNFSQSKFSQDPIIHQLDKKSFVISDPLNSKGMYNHLLWKGFSRPDKFHFDEASHLYQAEVLYDYIVNNNQFQVEQESFLEIEEGRSEIFDYASEFSTIESEFDFEKLKLLKAIYNVK